MNAPVYLAAAAQREQPPCLAVLGERGNVILYHQGETNHCPSCGSEQWHVGRIVAQCARCDAAVPLTTPVSPDLETHDLIRSAA